MESHSGEKWSRLFLRSRLPSRYVIPSSDIQIHPLGIDLDLSRFLLVGREYFGRSRIFSRSRIFHRSGIFGPVENVFCRDNLIVKCRGSRVDCRWSEIIVT